MAEQLGKFAYEVTQLSPKEFARWLAYFRIKQKSQQEAREKARRNSKGRRR